jgi:hypothetical protein
LALRIQPGVSSDVSLINMICEAAGGQPRRDTPFEDSVLRIIEGESAVAFAALRYLSQHPGERMECTLEDIAITLHSINVRARAGWGVGQWKKP